MDIRDNLRIYIEKKSLKQSSVAAKAGISPSKLCATLKKKRALDANELFSICDALQIKPSELREKS